MRIRVAAFAVAATLIAATITPAASANAHRASRPDPSNFTAGRVTNEWFPLKPGTRMVYRGVKDGKHARDAFYVTHRTMKIEGVVCRAVRDRLFLNGFLAERTVDWYAQSKRGDVWYFGERTAELDRNGKVTTREGSWRAGRNGARPGVYITAHPRVGQTRRQEFYRGHAQDHFKIIETSATVAVPMLRSTKAVLTKEWTPLEPHVIDHKYYVRDIGVVSEQTVRGPQEINKLVSVEHEQ